MKIEFYTLERWSVILSPVTISPCNLYCGQIYTTGRFYTSSAILCPVLFLDTISQIFSNKFGEILTGEIMIRSHFILTDQKWFSKQNNQIQSTLYACTQFHHSRYLVHQCNMNLCGKVSFTNIRTIFISLIFSMWAVVIVSFLFLFSFSLFLCHLWMSSITLF